jgi:hypothetical protein
VFYESSQYRQITVLKMEHILCRAGNYKFSRKAVFDRNKTEVSLRRTAVLSSNVHAYGRDKEMSVNKFMQLWEYGYFVVQELDNVYTKNCGNKPWT